MGDLYLIRHAQASFGKPDYDELSELGFHQARLLADFFERTGRTFDALYCGEMKRHRDTAAHFKSKTSVVFRVTRLRASCPNSMSLTWLRWSIFSFPC